MNLSADLVIDVAAIPVMVLIRPTVSRLVLAALRELALLRAVLVKRRTRAALGHAKLRADTQCRHGGGRGLVPLVPWQPL